jgi:hypothetical protein
MWLHDMAGIIGSADRLHLVVESVRLDRARRRGSIAQIPADGAEGAEVGCYGQGEVED